jgi:hypothetical protein
MIAGRCLGSWQLVQVGRRLSDICKHEASAAGSRRLHLIPETMTGRGSARTVCASTIAGEPESFRTPVAVLAWYRQHERGRVAHVRRVYTLIHRYTISTTPTGEGETHGSLCGDLYGLLGFSAAVLRLHVGF